MTPLFKKFISQFLTSGNFSLAPVHSHVQELLSFDPSSLPALFLPHMQTSPWNDLPNLLGRAIQSSLSLAHPHRLEKGPIRLIKVEYIDIEL